MPTRAAKELGQLTPAAFRDYVRFSSVETVMMHFRNLDADGSGELTKKEFRLATKKMGFEATKEECDMVFGWLDHNGSGTVPFKELDLKLREHPVEMESLRPKELPVGEEVPAAVAAPAPAPEARMQTQDAGESWSRMRGPMPAASTALTTVRAPKKCSCEDMTGRNCQVWPAALFLRSGPSLESEALGVLPKGAKVVILEEVRPEPSLVRVRVAMETNESLPVGWVTSCREGHVFIKAVSASLTPRGWYTSALTGGDGFSRLTYSMRDVRDRYNSVAGTISLLQQQASDYQRREEVLLLTGKDVPLISDPMAQWAFQGATRFH